VHASHLHYKPTGLRSYFWI